MKKIMKKLLSLLALYGLFLIGCSEQDTLNPLSTLPSSTEKEMMTKSEGQNQRNWREEIAYALDSIPSILVENQIRLLNYEKKYSIESQEQIEELKRKLLAEEAYFPISLENNQKYIFLKLKEIESHEQYKEYYNFYTLEKNVDTLFSIGDIVLQLSWEYKGSIINSLCIVNEKSGVIYDNILSHLFIVEEEIIEHPGEAYDLYYTPSRIKTRSGEGGSTGGGSTGGGSTGGGSTGGGGSGSNDPVWRKQPVYKTESKSLQIKSVVGLKLGNVIYAHTAKGLALNGIIEMTSSEMEGHASAIKGSAAFDYKYIEKRMGVDGISTVRFIYFITIESMNIKITWNGDHASVEGNFDGRSSATGVADHTISTKESGWLMGQPD